MPVTTFANFDPEKVIKGDKDQQEALRRAVAGIRSFLPSISTSEKAALDLQMVRSFSHFAIGMFKEMQKPENISKDSNKFPLKDVTNLLLFTDSIFLLKPEQFRRSIATSIPYLEEKLFKRLSAETRSGFFFTGEISKLAEKAKLICSDIDSLMEAIDKSPRVADEAQLNRRLEADQFNHRAVISGVDRSSVTKEEFDTNAIHTEYLYTAIYEVRDNWNNLSNCSPDHMKGLIKFTELADEIFSTMLTKVDHQAGTTEGLCFPLSSMKNLMRFTKELLGEINPQGVNVLGLKSPFALEFFETRLCKQFLEKPKGEEAPLFLLGLLGYSKDEEIFYLKALSQNLDKIKNKLKSTLEAAEPPAYTVEQSTDLPPAYTEVDPLRAAAQPVVARPEAFPVAPARSTFHTTDV